MSSSWNDDRLNFTGDGKLSAPTVTRNLKCQIKGNFLGWCWKWGYETSPPFIWMPSFDYATPNSVEKSISEDFMTIQNV